MDLKSLRSELDRRRVAVWSAGEKIWKPIPVALTPTIVKTSEWQDVVSDARRIFNTFPKVLSWLQRPEQAQLKEGIFAGLSSIERAVIDLDPLAQWGHVTARFDLFWDCDQIKIIEVNCTIPAMQSYSDGVLNAWLKASGQDVLTRGNMGQLLESLLSAYRGNGGRTESPKVAILHRPGDSQMGELMSLQEEWGKCGVQAVLATPSMVARSANQWFIGQMPVDLIYRHIFAWRLEDSPFASCLINNRQTHIYNPVSAHYESKAFLALVSHMSSDTQRAQEVGFSRDEMAAVNLRVPWSRILGQSPLSVPFEEVKERLPYLVFKRSVGYGGHQVVMGQDWETHETQTRLKQLTGCLGHVDFNHFASWILKQDTSLWIAQNRMSGAQRRTQVLCGDQLEEWDGWFDASVFIDSGKSPVCSGGVSRISKSPIVNIGTGGGLAPFQIIDN